MITSETYLTKLARVLGGQSGLQVVLREGAVPRTDGKKIVLPSLSDAEVEKINETYRKRGISGLDIINGLLDHEASHTVFTFDRKSDSGAIMAAVNATAAKIVKVLAPHGAKPEHTAVVGKVLFMFANVAEDIRCETLWVDRFMGSESFFYAMYLDETMDPTERHSEKSVEVSLAQRLWNVTMNLFARHGTPWMQRAISERKKVLPTPNAFDEKILAFFSYDKIVAQKSAIDVISFVSAPVTEFLRNAFDAKRKAEEEKKKQEAEKKTQAEKSKDEKGEKGEPKSGKGEKGEPKSGKGEEGEPKSGKGEKGEPKKKADPEKEEKKKKPSKGKKNEEEEEEGLGDEEEEGLGEEGEGSPSKTSSEKSPEAPEEGEAKPSKGKGDEDDEDEDDEDEDDEDEDDEDEDDEDEDEEGDKDSDSLPPPASATTSADSFDTKKLLSLVEEVEKSISNSERFKSVMEHAMKETPPNDLSDDPLKRWKVLTTEKDTTDEVRPANQETIEKFYNEVRQASLGHLGRHLLGEFSRRYVPASEGPRLNQRQLATFATPFPALDSAFLTTAQKKVRKNIAVELIIDCSGSMTGEKLKTAALSAGALSLLLDRLQIPFSVYGFSTGENLGNPYNIYDSYTRRSVIKHYIFKPFNKAFKAVLGSLANYRSVSQAANIDGESISTLSTHLLMRPEKRKILIVLSDGFPACGNHDEQYLSNHLKAVVKKLEKTPGLEVYAIGLTGPHEYGAVRNFYTNYEILTDFSKLPELMLKLFMNGKKKRAA